MPMDMLVAETQGMPEELVMQVVRFARFLREEYLADGGGAPARSAARRRRGLRRGQITMSADFDDPLDDFADYMR